VASILKSIEDHKELLVLFVAAVGGMFALWRWMVDQKWRRVQYAQSLIREFLQKESTISALEILDVLDENVELKSHDIPKGITIEITDELLVRALSTSYTQKTGDEQTLFVRTVLDEFFGDLSIFQSHIEAGLIKLQDIKPYLEYWLNELSGPGRMGHTSPFTSQVYSYLLKFGYTEVVTLAKNMDHPFPKDITMNNIENKTELSKQD
jgi:hypothetical protein